MIIRIVFFCLALILSSEAPALAAPWDVYKNMQSGWGYDEGTVAPDGSGLVTTSLVFYAAEADVMEGKSYNYSVVELVIDCSSATLKMNSISYFDDKQKAVSNFTADKDAEWSPISGGAEETLLYVGCDAAEPPKGATQEDTLAHAMDFMQAR